MRHPRLRIEPLYGDSFYYDCEGDEVIVGRSQKADVSQPADEHLSRLHARLFLLGDQWYLEDLKSRNGTFLNGQQVFEPMQIEGGDEIVVSDTILLVESPDGPKRELERKSKRDDDSSGSVYVPAQSVIEDSDPFSSRSLVATDEDPALKRYVERMQLLNEVHQALTSPVSLPDLLELILDRIFVHLQPDEATIFLRSEPREDDEAEPEDGGLGYRLAAARRRPGFAGGYFQSSRLAEQVMEKRLAALVVDARADTSLSSSDSVILAGIRSLVAAPLQHAAGCPGMIVLSSRDEERQFDAEDLELLVSIAAVAAVHMWNLALKEEAARRRELERELRLAREIQVALFPQSLPQHADWEIHASNQPSRTVSGDLYRVLERAGTDEWVFLIADVSGKGISASLLTASLEALSAAPMEMGPPPDVICRRLSRRFFERTPANRFATAVVAVLEPGNGRFQYANAGHEPGLLVRRSGEVEKLDPTGSPLGMWPESEFEAATTVLEPGDLVLIYTDGLSEAVNPEGEEYGTDRLCDVCVELRARPMAELVAALKRDLESFAHGVPFTDDRTLVLLRRRAT